MLLHNYQKQKSYVGCMWRGFGGEKIKDKIGHFCTSKGYIGTILHICEEQVGHFYTSMACKQDTFTHLDEASGILLHIYMKQVGYFYTTGRV